MIKRKQKQGFRAVIPDIEISHLEGTIIAAFFPEAEEITIKEIQERTGYSYERVNTALKSLVKKSIVQEKEIGKTLVYVPNLDNLYAESIGFNAYMLQRELGFIRKHKIVYNAVKEIKANPHVWGVILFGSYSKGTETRQSDIDIICMSNRIKETESFIRSLKHKYSFKFAPVVMPLYDFPNIKKDNPELWHDIKMYGIVFRGDDYFYHWMYKDEK